MYLRIKVGASVRSVVRSTPYCTYFADQSTDPFHVSKLVSSADWVSFHAAELEVSSFLLDENYYFPLVDALRNVLFC